MAADDSSQWKAFFAHVPMIGRGAVGIALRAVAGKREAVDLLAQKLYLDEFDGAPDEPWAKLPAKRKKEYRGYVTSTLEGLDDLVKAATTG